MKKIILSSFIMLAFLTGLRAESVNNELVELAEIYRNFMFRNSPTVHTYKQLAGIRSAELTHSVRFIKETITSNNRLTNTEFLRLPDEQTLTYLYIIKRINWNIRKDIPENNEALIAELLAAGTSRYELIDSYYDMLFSGVANKNQPFDLSAVDFYLNDYALKDDTEKGIFFLKAMDLCGTVIWGYMNVVNPPNYKLAHKNIKKYPKFNGQPYYQYLSFSFPDFEMELQKDKGKESYKAYYMNKYYDTLLSHLLILSRKRKYEEEKYELLLGSILKEENYYKYSKRKTILNSLFTGVER